MELLQDGIIAALSAVGVTALIWLTAELFLRPRREATMPTFTIVPARGDAEALEATIRTIRRTGGACRTRVLILDEGLCARSRAVAELLSRGDDVCLCTKETLWEEMRREYGRADDGHRHGAVGDFSE